MRTPRPLLGIFALALLLPLLLLACGGSDEPTGGRSSERATDEPESRTSSGRTTLAPTSPETDREALVGFYNATGGPNWNDNNNWLSDVPISEWEGVATDGNGRVTELYLENQEPVEGGDTAGVGQPRQPGTAATRGEPVERVRAKQFVRPVGYG